MSTERIIAGQYRLVEQLGAGAMGEVWRAIDTTLERNVAVKSLRPELAANAAFVDRFRTEAVVLAKLHHPNIATLYTIARESDSWYMVMEFVPGVTLDALLAERGPIPWQDVCVIAIRALAGLGHAHVSGVVHRDVKPANIMIRPNGEVKLTDFGIARALDRSRMTRQGNWVGTIEYASPEQVRGEAVDQRSDLYSLGIVMFELLTGKLPFAASTDYELMKAQLETLAPPLGSLLVGAPKRLESALARALAKTPTARFADANEFAAALQSVLDEVPAAPSGPGLGDSIAELAGKLKSAGSSGLADAGRRLASLRTDGSGLRAGVVGAKQWVISNPALSGALVLATVATTLIIAAMMPSRLPVPAPPVPDVRVNPSAPDMAQKPAATSPTAGGGSGPAGTSVGSGDLPRVVPVETPETPKPLPRVVAPETPRAPEPRVAEPRVAEPRVAEPRVAEPRAPEPRRPDSSGGWYIRR